MKRFDSIAQEYKKLHEGDGYKLTNMDEFRAAAMQFKDTGRYTNAIPSQSKNSTYYKFWKQEAHRCLNGYHTGYDYIPGYYYHYLNYSPIFVAKEVDSKRNNNKNKGDLVQAQRIVDFPYIWDGDYYSFHYIDEAERSGNHGVVIKSRGRGYANSLKTNVLQRFGSIKMGDIEPGTLILNPVNGLEQKVLEVYPQGKIPMYRVILSDGRTTECSDNHLWNVEYKGKTKVVTTLEMLDNGLYNVFKQGFKIYKYRLPKIAVIQYDSPIQSIPPYVVGALIGDGSISMTANNQVRLSNPKSFIRDKVISLLPEGYNMVYDESTSCNYRINTGGSDYLLYKHIKKYELNKFAKDKFIPDDYLRNSVENRLELLRGLMDTDGYISTGSNMEYTTISRRLASDVANLCRSLSMEARVSHAKREGKQSSFIDGREIKKGNYYRVHIRTNEQIFSLPEKANRLRIKRLDKSARIVNIVRIEDQLAKCILVDSKDHLYLVDDFIPTHNSFKGGSMLTRNYYHIPGSNNFAFATQKDYLIRDGVLSKAWDVMDFIDANTPWSKKRQVKNQDMHRRASYVVNHNGVPIEKGYKSDIIGISFNNNPDAGRGIRAKLILWEEFGNFPNGLQAWRVAMNSMKQGSLSYGLMLAYGCFCKGTKVYTNEGKLINVEDLNIEDGIIGYDSDNTCKSEIANINPPAKKICYRIETTNGNFIECSYDHPLFKSLGRYTVNKINNVHKITNEIASNIKIGDHLAMANEIPFFGNKKIFNARLFGLLIGDGSYSNGSMVELAISNRDVYNYIESNYDISEYNVKKIINVFYKKIGLLSMQNSLRENGMYGQVKDYKRFPNDIHTYSKKSLSEFIAGYYDADGNIKVVPNKSIRVILTSVVYELLNQMKYQLLKFGIHSSIIKENRNPDSIKISDNQKDYIYRLYINKQSSVRKFYDSIPVLKDVARLSKIKHYKVYSRDGVKPAKFIFNEELNKGHYFKGKTLSNIKLERVKSIKCIGLQDIYNLTVKETHNYLANSFLAINTGGSNETSFEAIEELTYNPSGYQVHPIINVFDQARYGTPCGFFHPVVMNQEGFYDENGNSDIEGAKNLILKQRVEIEKNTSDTMALARAKAEEPMTIQEALLSVTSNIFPVNDCMMRRSTLEAYPEIYEQTDYVGFITFNEDGSTKWNNSKLASPIRKFPIRSNDNKEGAIILFEPPVKINNEVPKGVYIAGLDPVDHNESQTDSLPSMFILNLLTDRIVAEYTGRPPRAEEYYENARRLLIHYNAICMYENNLKGLYSYFKNKSSLYLLAKQPSILQDISPNSLVNRGYGAPGTIQVNKYCRGLIASFLLDLPSADSEVMNVYKIRSMPLLRELELWNIKKNFDRVSAFGMLLLYRNELNKNIEELSKKVHKRNKNKAFSKDSFLRRNYNINSNLMTGFEDTYNKNQN